ncbi:hypothetical protein MNBD_PLANCTO03-1208 [hydrothermal vent metagenome]|uniref:Uncharacterized protein n=1 Tax=hydrothermal vent metagenome TaxID=652676 RepID=A0A3B1E397_9ZZZZ
MVACWGLALILNTQGWVPTGGDWLAADGSSFWSRCGSAMCACGPEAWSVTPGYAEETNPEEICCEEEEARQFALAGQGHDGPTASASWFSGLGLMALGNHRRQHSEGASLPEVVVLDLPADRVSEIDRLFPLSSAAAPEGTHMVSRVIDIPVPPPKA